MKGRTGKNSHIMKPVHMGDPDILMDKPMKHGGKVKGEKTKPRADKMSRGGEPKKWMQHLDIKKGSMTKAAEREGVSNAKYEQEHKNDKGKAGKRARLALVFKKSKH